MSVTCMYDCSAPTAPPDNVTVVDDTPSSVHITWDAPPYEMQNGHIRQYNVEITEVETGDVLKFKSNFTNIIVNDLVPFYNYSCTVSAETVGAGPPSDEILFVLPEGRKVYLFRKGFLYSYYYFLIQHLMDPQRMSLDSQLVLPVLTSTGIHQHETSKMAI